MIDLKDKVAIVSGGATLIGKKVAEELARAGANVTICDIDEAGGKQAEEELGIQVKFIKTDVTDDKQIDEAINQTVDNWGGIDYLVNVACTYLDNGLASTREEWQKALDVNIISGAIFVQKVTPYMKERGGGAVVNFGSISGKRAQPGRLLYTAAKAGIIGITRNEAMLLADDNIRVNSVSPGWTWSNVIREMTGDDRKKADRVAEPLHLSGRTVDPSEVAKSVVFLCSDAASGVNGTDLAVDCGYTAIGPEQKVDMLPQLAE